MNKGKSCKGCLYYSSLLKSNSRNPVCAGISRTLQQVPGYIVGESEMEASKEGWSLSNFKYACVGYSVFLDNKDTPTEKREKQVELPFCVGIEDLSKLNRDPSRVLYVSGHAQESCLQPENCVPIKPWKLEDNDTTLVDIIPFLEYVARNRPADIRAVLASYEGHDIATAFIERSKEYQRMMQEQKLQGWFWRR